jgi:hypothetical protein
MIDFDKSGGLVPAIAQDADNGTVLMMAWMNREAYEETLRTKRAVYFSRSRNKLWRKGEESGNWQEVREIATRIQSSSRFIRWAGRLATRATRAAFSAASRPTACTSLGSEFLTRSRFTRNE